MPLSDNCVSGGLSTMVILTGAGASAESGIDTFRAADGQGAGLWEQHRIEDVATPQGFRRDPALVHRFYDARRVAVQRAEPNAAHRALARLDTEWPGELLIVTQNVDDLHERAGARRLLHMHGELLSALCAACGERHRWIGPLGDGPACPACRQVALRPDVVWFGEMPYEMERIYRALQRWTCSSPSAPAARSIRRPASLPRRGCPARARLS